MISELVIYSKPVMSGLHLCSPYACVLGCQISSQPCQRGSTGVRVFSYQHLNSELPADLAKSKPKTPPIVEVGRSLDIGSDLGANEAIVLLLSELSYRSRWKTRNQAPRTTIYQVLMPGSGASLGSQLCPDRDFFRDGEYILDYRRRQKHGLLRWFCAICTIIIGSFNRLY